MAVYFLRLQSHPRCWLREHRKIPELLVSLKTENPFNIHTKQVNRQPKPEHNSCIMSFLRWGPKNKGNIADSIIKRRAKWLPRSLANSASDRLWSTTKRLSFTQCCPRAKSFQPRHERETEYTAATVTLRKVTLYQWVLLNSNEMAG